ncbi:MAG TPA: phosphatase PAP2/dual specificity phosphatase family protein [Chthoniobacterales bacterium]|nr:phosphatase PAP2/dual specificity phosphatase family protein [Chthoniobacterales bacterium]
MAAKPHFDGIERRSARSTLRALAASAGLSILFLIVYGWTNWFTSQRSDVGTLFFEWERLIPFVPLMIAPYMSIDLFFIAAPFLCRSDRELVTFSKRIAAAILVAGLCFLLFPLRFAFERPQADGWLGAVFDWFRTIDQPYNLLPSLHITLRTILAEFYARHTRGLLRHASNLWFVLIGLSAVLTYQHHVMDVVAGFALGAYCLYFIREPAPPLPVLKNRRVGAYYGIGALLLVGLVVGLWPWGAFLIWPAISLAISAVAYFGLGPGIFRKRDGRLPWTAWWALGPCLLGQQLSRFYYRRQCRAWDRLTPQIWIGSVLSRREAATAVRLGVTAVLDLTAEFSEPAPFRGVTYRNIPILDLTAPPPEQLDEMVAFISRNIDFQSVRPAELHSAESAAAESDEESRNGIVYIHCKIGYSRTAAAAAAYLLHTGAVSSVPEAIDVLRKVRPMIIVRPEIVAALTDFSSRRQSTAP